MTEQNNTIDRIPKNLYEAHLVIKKFEGETRRLQTQVSNLSSSLSKANKKIEHLLKENSHISAQLQKANNVKQNSIAPKAVKKYMPRGL